MKSHTQDVKMRGGTYMSVIMYVCQYVSVRVGTDFFPLRQ